MSIAILSLYTTAHAPLNAITEPTKEQYANRWGYTFINHFGTLDESRPPAFSKIKLIQRQLKYFDWIYWIDADAAVMNCDIPLEEFLVDYDLIIAQEPALSHYGDYQFNTGSFFMRNSAWSHKLLETAYSQEQFRNHIYWDQAAIRHAIHLCADFGSHVYIETNPKRFNSFAYNYSKGDFIFHAVNFSSSVKIKEELLLRTMQEDLAIHDTSQPKLGLIFLTNRDDEAHHLLGEYALPSLVRSNRGGDDVSIEFLDVTPSVLAVSKHGTAFSTLLTRVKLVSDMLRHREGSYIAFARPDTQFLGANWGRFCLIQLAKDDGVFIEQGKDSGVFGDAFFVLKVSSQVTAYFQAAAKFLEDELRDCATTRISSFAEMIELIQPDTFGCRFKLFSDDGVQNVAQHPGGFDILKIRVHSLECLPEIARKRESAASIQSTYSEHLVKLRDLRFTNE